MDIKQIILLLLITFFCTCGFGEFSNAQDTVLNAKQVNELFTEKTFTVTEAKPDKKTGKVISYQMHASNNGAINVISKEVRPEPRIWSVKEDGSLCYSRKLSQDSRGRNCSYIVPDGKGVYI